MDRQLDRIRKAYDLTASEHGKGLDPLAKVPTEFRNSREFRAFQKAQKHSPGSGDPAIREYLGPERGMRFLDTGCSANLSNYRLDRWASTYDGVDISPALIEAMNGFVAARRISIGGLWVAHLAELPFDDSFFDIAAAIGVYEYSALEYIETALAELRRVIKPGGRAVVDVPNLQHPLADTMFRLEVYLGRPKIPYPREAYEEVLARTSRSCEPTIPT